MGANIAERSDNLAPNVERMAMPHPFFTIGHSTRSISDFVALLEESKVKLVVDVRTVPRSRHNPQYNEDALPASLAPFGIAYERIAELGGLRPRSKTVNPEINAFWEKAPFHNYADYAMGAPFRAGLARLRDLGHARPSAIMCAEAVWWRCHRRIVADHLLAAGERVRHIMGPGQVDAAELTEGGRVSADGTVTYPPLGQLPLL